MPIKDTDLLNSNDSSNVFDTSKQGVVNTYDQSYSTKDIDLINNQIPGGLTNPEQLENLKALNQSTVSKLSNDLVVGLGKTASGLIRDIGLIAGGINYLANSLNPNKEGTVEDFKNPLVTGTENFDQAIEEALPHYQTTDEKENPAALRNIMSTSFWGKTMLREAIPFAATAYLEGMGLGKILGGTAKLAYAQRLAKLGGEFAVEGAKLSKNINWANKAVTGTIVNYNEAAFESLNTSDRVYEEVLNSLSKDIQFGKITQEEAELKAKELSEDAFQKSFMINFAILRATDYQFDHLFKSSLQSRRSTSDLFKELSKKENVLKYGGKYFKNAGLESLQELTQGALSDELIEASKEGKSLSLIDSIANTISSIPGRMGTQEGIIEMLSSTILSAGISGIQDVTSYKDERNNKSFREDAFNKSIAGEATLKPEEVLDQKTDELGNITTFLSAKGKEKMREMSSYAEFEVMKQTALSQGNKEVYQKALEYQVANMAYGHFEAGLGENFQDKLQGEIEKTKAELIKSGEKFMTDHYTNEKVTPEEYIQQVKEKTKKYEKIYNSLQDQFDIKNPSIRKLLYFNAIGQAETKQKIDTTPISIGSKFLTYKDSNPTLKALTDDKAAEHISITRDIEQDIVKKAYLSTILDDYLEEKAFNDTAALDNIITNLKNKQSRHFNQQYFNSLKESFQLLTDDKKLQEFNDSIKSNTEDQTKIVNNTSTKKETPKVQEKEVITTNDSVELPDSEDIEPEVFGEESSQDVNDLFGATNTEDLGEFGLEESIVEEQTSEITSSVTAKGSSYLGELAQTAFKIAYNTRKYFIVETEEDLIKRKDSSKYNEGYNVENSNPENLLVGTKLLIKKEKSTRKYVYVTKNGNIEYKKNNEGRPVTREAVEGEYDLVVTDEQGNKLGNIHEINWVLASEKGSKLNIQDKDFQKEVDKLKELWDRFAIDSTPIETFVSYKSNGKLSVERTEDDKPVFKPLKETINKFMSKRIAELEQGLTKPLIGFTLNGSIEFGNSSYNPLENNSVNDVSTYKDGSIVLLGTTANNKDIVLPLNINLIQDKSDTVIGLIKMLKKPFKDIDQFRKLGYNSANASTIKEQLNNFIYLYDYNIDKNFSSLNKNQNIRIGIRSKEDIIDIKIVYKNSEGLITTRTFEDIKNMSEELQKEFSTTLKEIEQPIKNSFLNVTKDKVTKYDTVFKLPVFKANKIEIQEYPNYLDYLATDVISTDIREFGEGYLFEQPVIALNQDEVYNKVEVIEETKEETKTEKKDSTKKLKGGLRKNKGYNPNKDVDLSSVGLTPEQGEYYLRNDLIEDMYFKDNEGNSLLSLNRQSLFKSVFIASSLEDFLAEKKPSEIFNNFYTSLLDTISDNNQFTSEQDLESYKQEVDSEDYIQNLSWKEIQDSTKELTFLTKPEVFEKLVSTVKEDLKNIYGVSIKLDNYSPIEIQNTTEEQEDSENDIDGSEDRSKADVESKDSRSEAKDSSENDPRKNLSWKMKLFLSDVPYPNTVLGGYTVYYTYDKVFNTVLQELANIVNKDFNSIIAKLEKSKNQINNIVAIKLLQADEQLKNQFITPMLLEKSTYKVESFDKDGKLDVFNSNRNDNIIVTLEDFSNRLQTSDLVTIKNDEYYINKKEVENLNKLFELAQTGNLDTKAIFIKTLFNKLNLTDESIDNLVSVFTNDATIVQYLSNEKYKTVNDLFKSNGLFGIVMDKALIKNLSSKEDILLESNNPFKGESSQGATRHLARIYNDVFNISGSSNFKSGEGKNMWSYNLRSQTSDIFYKTKEDIEWAKQKLTLAFSSTSKYLIQFDNYLKKSTLSYHDALKMGKNVKRRDKFDKGEQILSLLAEFSESSYFNPTLSDKTKSNLQTTYVDKVELIFANNEIVFDKKTIERVYAIIKGEHKRIKEFKDYVNTSGKTEIELKFELGQYYEGASKYFLFPELNEHPEFPNETDYSNWLKNTFIPNKLKDYIGASIKEMGDNGITYNRIPSILVSKYSVSKNDNEKLQEVVANITLNYIEYYANYMYLYGGDPALFSKKDSIPKTLEEYIKRGAKDIAPGLQGNFENPLYKVVFVKSLELDITKSNSYLKTLFPKGYDADITDAQEFTTLKEHLEVMYAFGKEVNQAKYKEYLNKLKVNPEYEFSNEELQDILNDEVLLAQKPIQVDERIKTVGNHSYNNIYYIKSSSIPLIPQYTKGTALDIVRKAMEKKHIARLAFDSAVKTGGSKIIGTGNTKTLFNEDESINYSQEELEQSFEVNSHTLNRKGFRIQQELPYKADKFQILTVSQMNKLLFDGISNIDFTLDNKSFTGLQLQELKENIRKRLFTLSAEELNEKLGVKIVEKSIEVTNMKKLIGSLRDEAISRNYPLNDIQSLTLDNDGKLIIPLAFNNSFSKFEGLITSMFSKIVLQKQTGKSFVQTSAVGLKYLNEVNTSGIVYTKEFDSKKGLQYIDNDKPFVEVVIPWIWTELDINSFIDVDGRIKEGSIDEKLLQLIGARIPNQTFSSQLPIKVVGFLPSIMKDMIIVPNGITKQMGSDFDIDKLYTYLSNFEVIEGRLVSKPYSLENDLNSFTRDQLQDVYKDIHWSILTNPEVLKRVVQPLDLDDLQIETEKVLKASNKGPSILDIEPLLWTNQVKNFDSNKNAKALVGSSALYTTFNVLIQNLDMKLAQDFGTISIFSKGGKTLNLEYLSNPKKATNLGTTFNKEKRTVSDNLNILENAVLDNAKNPIAGKLNINDLSFGPLATLIMLKDKSGESLDISYLARFVMQPEIQDYIKQMVKDKSSINNPSGFYLYESTYLVKKAELEAELSKLDNKDVKTKVFSEEDLLDYLNPKIEKDAQYYYDQIKFLETFNQLQKVADTLLKVQITSNSDSKGSSKNFIEILDKRDKIEDIKYNTDVIEGIKDVFIKGSTNTEIGLATNYAVDYPLQVFKNIVPFTQDWYQDIEKNIKKALGKENLSKDNRQQIWKEFRSFLFTNPNLLLFNNDITTERERLLKGDSSLANRLEVFKNNPEYATNLLIQRLYTQYDVKTFNKVLYRAAVEDSLEQKNIIDGFISLFEGTSIERKFAKDLVTYNYITGGNQTSINFAKFIPIAYLMATNYKNIDNIDTLEVNNFVRQFVQNNYDLTKRIPTGTTEQPIDIQNAFTVLDNGNTLKYKSNGIANTELTDENGFFMFKYLSKPGKSNEYALYELDWDTQTYFKIPIGGTYNVGFLEYDYSKPMITSILPKNNPSVIKEGNDMNPSPMIKNIDLDLETLTNKFESFDKKGLVRALKDISKTSTSPYIQKLGEFMSSLESIIPNNIQIQLDNYVGDKPVRGKFKVDANNQNKIIQVFANEEKKWSEKSNISFEDSINETILHEILHSITYNLVDLYRTDPNNKFFKQNAQVASIIKNLVDVYKTSKIEFNKVSGSYSRNTPEGVSLQETFKDLDEFIVRSLTDPNTQKYLKSLKTANKSVFDRLKTIITSLFKELASIVGIDIKGTVLEEVVGNSVDLLNEMKVFKLSKQEINQQENKEDIDLSSTGTLNTSLSKFMQSLTVEEREKLRILRADGTIKIACK